MSQASPVQRITCENPSPMTLQGTNTYVLGADLAQQVVIIDPGPAGHPEHLAQVRAVVGPRRVAQILVTHRHADHTGAAASFSEAFAAPVRGHSREQCIGLPDQPAAALTDGEIIELGGLRLSVLHTPGHTSDSVCFWLHGDADRHEQAMFTGDTILGEGTTMLDHPDGTLTDYLQSLRRLSEHARARLLPAHGPAQPSVAEAARRYLAHRIERLEQVRELLRTAENDGTSLDAATLGKLIYGERAGLPAGITTKIAAAQLQHLQHLGER
ncbi:MBL fold metallo-hydrolase [Nesterenkonia sp. LB17]|uniref:MBL fold metallo-hydrolase n=1 Tax=unclassified Nesterenkonia TaxID=2629769 RepID=UPI001F4C57A7|nr:MULTISPECIES: MBL fold metallo-hydrolase [unclassified Nesterenkonia]MCH8560067.1 MBL fold metallo-hydrolase [Nesterenkonia sp. DZ6]MCH8562248.1 MBL fold metallo-hydrolase [Nesterenkonia sp. YGD6]MCH8564220.1 MBL fold metallo-hydrolase [Nesterenkonia sp. LB17]MCH8569849.1 MBL fold metallo-hydrolase [Nesterenkonia sp. AY15]